MTEPFYIAQTFEPEHVKDFESRRAWFAKVVAEAKAKGGKFPRYTISEDGAGLLFECWKEVPRPVWDQGEPRWTLALCSSDEEFE